MRRKTTSGRFSANAELTNSGSGAPSRPIANRRARCHVERDRRHAVTRHFAHRPQGSRGDWLQFFAKDGSAETTLGASHRGDWGWAGSNRRPKDYEARFRLDGGPKSPTPTRVGFPAFESRPGDLRGQAPFALQEHIDRLLAPLRRPTLAGHLQAMHGQDGAVGPAQDEQTRSGPAVARHGKERLHAVDRHRALPIRAAPSVAYRHEVHPPAGGQDADQGDPGQQDTAGPPESARPAGLIGPFTGACGQRRSDRFRRNRPARRPRRSPPP